MIKDMILFGKILYEQRLNHSHSGNISIRKGNNILIKRHGAMLGYLTEKDIVHINLHDESKDKLASLEAKVHRAIYLNNPDIKAIAHAHTIYATVISFKNKIIKPIDSEGAFYLPQIPVLSCEQTICSTEVADKIPELISKYKVAIVKTHGTFAGGKTLEEACLYLSVVENASKIIYLNSLQK
ncbi:MAG: class II aldolase/adducin family protein [Endomicrobiaceae bacterium]|nr:class II aldolase/adducin family protein [Endomicrobiaceae bacterium]MDD3922255.1 class II aldolase/adducin family protein [Endomicrobiaceae bacterium]MDD5101412.1 class II aldolase/adducin family protein [Endomicrobiaceae bacterium]